MVKALCPTALRLFGCLEVCLEAMKKFPTETWPLFLGYMRLSKKPSTEYTLWPLPCAFFLAPSGKNHCNKNSRNPTENFWLETNNYLKTWPNTLPTNLSVSHHFPIPSKTRDTSLQNSFFKSTILIIKDVLDLSRPFGESNDCNECKKISNVLTLDQLCLEILHVTFWQSQRHGILIYPRNLRWMCSGSMVYRHLAKQLGWPTITQGDVANSHETALLSTFHLPTF